MHICNQQVCKCIKQLSKYTKLKANIRSLNSDTYLISAIANDISYDDITPLLPAGAIALLTVATNFVVDWMLHKSSGLKDVH